MRYLLFLLIAALTFAQQPEQSLSMNRSGEPCCRTAFVRDLSSSSTDLKKRTSGIDWALRLSQAAYLSGQAADALSTFGAINSGNAIESNRFLTGNPHQVGAQFVGVKVGLAFGVLTGGEWAARQHPRSRKAVIFTNLGLAAASWAIAGHNAGLLH